MAKETKKTDEKNSLDNWIDNDDMNNITSNDNQEKRLKHKEKGEGIVEKYLSKNENFSKKRNDKEDPDDLPKRIKFLQKEVKGNMKQLLVTDENHMKVKYAAQLCGVELQQFTNNVFAQFFATYKKELNQVRDQKISF